MLVAAALAFGLAIWLHFRSDNESPTPKSPRGVPTYPMSRRAQGIAEAQASEPPKRRLTDKRQAAAQQALEASAREREQAERIKREVKEELASNPRALADRLARLHEEGRKIRQRVKPDQPTLGQALSMVGHMFQYPHVAVSLEREAIRWNESVRNQLTLAAHRFIPDWEKCPTLPQDQILLMARLTADGPRLVAFLDARLGLLENIIKEIRQGQ